MDERTRALGVYAAKQFSVNREDFFAGYDACVYDLRRELSALSENESCRERARRDLLDALKTEVEKLKKVLIAPEHRYGYVSGIHDVLAIIRKHRVRKEKAVSKLGKPGFVEGELVRWRFNDGIGDWHYGPYTGNEIINQTACTIEPVHVENIDGHAIVREDATNG